MTEVINAKSFIEAKDTLADLLGQIDVIENTSTREELRLHEEYTKRIDSLKEELSSLRNNVVDRKLSAKVPLLERVDEVSSYIMEAKKVLKQLELRDKIEANELIEPNPEFYWASIVAALGEYYKDSYTWIKYFIVKNRKPKNCYTLLIVGNSKLYNLLDGFHHYNNFSIQGYFPILMGIADRPRVLDLLIYLERRDKLKPIAEYFTIRDSYIESLSKYHPNDFDDLKIVREVQEADAPIVFNIKAYERSSDFRIYKGFYYASVGGKAEKMDELQYIRVKDELYLRGGKAEGYTIEQTGNLMFGDWWSIGFTSGGTGTPFNKENWEKKLAEAEAFVKEHGGKDVRYNPPKITWIHPELIPVL